MAGLPEKNQNIDRTSKYTSPEFKPGPFEAVVINNLDPEFMGSITVQLRKVNESQGIAFADGELYTAKYLQPTLNHTLKGQFTKYLSFRRLIKVKESPYFYR